MLATVLYIVAVVSFALALLGLSPKALPLGLLAWVLVPALAHIL